MVLHIVTSFVLVTLLRYRVANNSVESREDNMTSLKQQPFIRKRFFGFWATRFVK